MDLSRRGQSHAPHSRASAPSAISARSILSPPACSRSSPDSLTRLAQFYTASEKTYEGVIRFGFATNTYDADGESVESREDYPWQPISSLDLLQATCRRIPRPNRANPSAILRQKNPRRPRLQTRQQTKRSNPEAGPSRNQRIRQSLAVEGDRAHFRARVSSGTYMRSIAHEMGQRLGCGAHLESLRRTSVAEFDIAQAHTIEEIEERIEVSQKCHEGKHSDRSRFPSRSGRRRR